MTYTYENYEETAAFIRQKITIQPQIGMILGSGLGELADHVEDATIIPYGDIPNWFQSTVKGHSGRLVIGKLEGQSVLMMQGRAHFYEGFSMQTVTFPVRVMKLLGIQTLIVTNAAGGVNPDFNAGDIMLIKDHINMPGLAGQNPLTGANIEAFGPRFPDMTGAYDKSLRQLAKTVAQKAEQTLQEGVYMAVAGPNFETPAEIRMAHIMGADSVGMSTVHEVVVARHCGIQVLGFSTIANKGIHDTDSEQDVSHEEVLAVGKTVVPRLMTIIRGVLHDISA